MFKFVRKYLRGTFAALFCYFFASQAYAAKESSHARDTCILSLTAHTNYSSLVNAFVHAIETELAPEEFAVWCETFEKQALIMTADYSSMLKVTEAVDAYNEKHYREVVVSEKRRVRQFLSRYRSKKAEILERQLKGFADDAELATALIQFSISDLDVSKFAAHWALEHLNDARREQITRSLNRELEKMPASKMRKFAEIISDLSKGSGYIPPSNFKDTKKVLSEDPLNARLHSLKLSPALILAIRNAVWTADSITTPQARAIFTDKVSAFLYPYLEIVENAQHLNFRERMGVAFRVLQLLWEMGPEEIKIEAFVIYQEVSGTLRIAEKKIQGTADLIHPDLINADSIKIWRRVAALKQDLGYSLPLSEIKNSQGQSIREILERLNRAWIADWIDDEKVELPPAKDEEGKNLDEIQKFAAEEDWLSRLSLRVEKAETSLQEKRNIVMSMLIHLDDLNSEIDDLWRRGKRRTLRKRFAHQHETLSNLQLVAERFGQIPPDFETFTLARSLNVRALQNSFEEFFLEIFKNN